MFIHLRRHNSLAHDDFGLLNRRRVTNNQLVVETLACHNLEESNGRIDDPKSIKWQMIRSAYLIEERKNAERG